MDISTREIEAAASLQASKAPAEGSWAKRSTGAWERLQPIRADATCAATHDNNNNSLKPVEAGAKNKSAVELKDFVRERKLQSKNNYTRNDRNFFLTIADPNFFLTIALEQPPFFITPFCAVSITLKR